MLDQITSTIEARVAPLRKIFLKNSAYRHFEQMFTELLERRSSEIAGGVTREARCVALIGGSGSGKTSAVRHLLAHHPRLALGGSETERLDVVSLAVPTPATLKFVGQTTLSALGFPLRRERTAQTIWDMVKDHLQARRTLFLHYDEAQDLALHQSPRELKSVVNTLKSLLQHQAWPVGLILTGTPELKGIINHDVQLARRVFPIEFPRLNAALDSERVLGLLSHYADASGLELRPDVIQRDLVARLIHAARCEFGLLIEMTIATIEGTIRDGRMDVEIADFARMFRKRSGCVDALNPFIADDFERIDVSRLLDAGEDD